ncbi:hypothetical protein EV643_12614 [Kribbella sp. VKM Ac-2527]|uniref:Uncharacterized protein n=1 Tax=Kribbella caucasensis TaxID=2512215 RepID=A0A4R6JJA2_9ACTN|nr:hypothetical protein [Kribbella sp. VKM Ac-2527]TDO34655.1 hypothetical protein EV643_12614 [Kribbella sp. VKM Ac-2527]
MIIHDESTERAAGNHHPLAPLTQAQLAHLVRLCVTAAAERGLHATYNGSDALLLEPRTEAFAPGFSPPLIAGLTNLARVVARNRQRDWPHLVATHFDELRINLHTGPPPPPADPERDLLLSLTPKTSLPPDWTAQTPEFLPSLLAVPCTYDDNIATLHCDPSDYGMTPAEAHQAGLANLCRLTDTVEYVENDGAQLAVLSDSPFAASRALVLDTVLRETLHIEDPPHGVLVALPVRSVLLIHVITDLSVLPALASLLAITLRTHTELPGPLTPWIYLAAPQGSGAPMVAPPWTPATTQPANLRDLRPSPAFLALAQTLSNLE